jgi:hypothetical protein
MDQTIEGFEDFDSLPTQVAKLQEFIGKLSAVSSGSGSYESEINTAYLAKKKAERELAEKLLILEKINKKSAMDYLIENKYVAPKIASISGVKYALKQTTPVWMGVLYYISLILMIIVIPVVLIYINLYTDLIDNITF